MSATWFKFYNDLVDDPRYVALSDAAWTLHIHGMAYCSKNLTDGVIPRGMIRRLCGTKDPMKAAKELVAAGMWAEDGDGWEVVDYLKGQRSKAQVEAERKANREKMADYRAMKAAKNAGNTSSNDGCNGVTHSVTNAVSGEEVCSTDTESESDTDNHLQVLPSHQSVSYPESTDLTDEWVTNRAMEQLDGHVNFRYEQISNPGGYRKVYGPKMADAIRCVIAAGGDTYDIDEELESRWPTSDGLWEPRVPASVERSRGNLSIVAAPETTEPLYPPGERWAQSDLAPTDVVDETPLAPPPTNWREQVKAEQAAYRESKDERRAKYHEQVNERNQ